MAFQTRPPTELRKEKRESHPIKTGWQERIHIKGPKKVSLPAKRRLQESYEYIIPEQPGFYSPQLMTQQKTCYKC